MEKYIWLLIQILALIYPIWVFFRFAIKGFPLKNALNPFYTDKDDLIKILKEIKEDMEKNPEKYEKEKSKSINNNPGNLN